MRRDVTRIAMPLVKGREGGFFSKNKWGFDGSDSWLIEYGSELIPHLVNIGI